VGGERRGESVRNTTDTFETETCQKYVEDIIIIVIKTNP
jgi:hypothetical protein